MDHIGFYDNFNLFYSGYFAWSKFETFLTNIRVMILI